MRPAVMIAQRLQQQEQELGRQRVVFESRKIWDAGEAMRDLRAISELEGEVRALSWALALACPARDRRLVGVPPLEASVVLEPVPGLGCWLLEVAPDPEPGFGNRRWGALLSDGQVRALADAVPRGLVRGEGGVDGGQWH
jgi:hypothetical protein